jgi:hypothetical protein
MAGLWDTLKSATTRGANGQPTPGYTKRAGDALRNGVKEARDAAADGKALLEKQDTQGLKDRALRAKDAAKRVAQKGRASVETVAASMAGSVTESLGKNVTRDPVGTLKRAGAETISGSTIQARTLLRKGGMYVLGIACASAFAYGLGSAIPKVGLEVYRERKRAQSTTDKNDLED